MKFCIEVKGPLELNSVALNPVNLDESLTLCFTFLTPKVGIVIISLHRIFMKISQANLVQVKFIKHGEHFGS